MILPARDTHWDPKTAHEYQQQVYEVALTYVRDFGVAIDCGAHVGIFTQRMELTFDRVYAFEPHPENFRCLAQNTTKAHLFNCCLWSVPSHVAMRLTDHPNSGAPEVIPGVDGLIPALPLDAFNIEGAGLIKLDVQDSESEVICGAVRTLKSNPVLIVEITGRDEHLLPLLKDIGYKQAAIVNKDQVWVR